ncbi:hypothetical protein AAIG39_15990 [Phytobacter palmae]|uniref:Alpha/beta hydrolase n=1 Tax=Phytobacter palmae TaxID=1855371 RepID=A0ABU9V9Q9_9ENTR
MIDTSSAIQKEVIYEDQNIIVLHKKGNSDFILCTFGDMVTLAQGDKIYAEKAIYKMDCAAIGFMAKNANWFPQDSVIKAIKRIEDIISNNKSIISYGGSMGGYAAIKYSKLLGASRTIACCPQWSIDPKECSGVKNGYERYFTDSLSDMGIKSEDVSGDVFILYDPHHGIDSYHFNNIKSKSEKVVGVHVPFVGHDVTTVMAGTENLRGMIESAKSLDVNNFVKIIRNARKNNSRRYEYVLKKSAVRHPYISAKIILLGKKRTLNELNVLNKAISILVRSGKLERALEIARLSMSFVDSDKQVFIKEIVTAIELLSFKEPKQITTSHNTVLFYNSLTSTLRHEKEESVMLMTRILRKVYTFSQGGDEYLVIRHEGRYHFIDWVGGSVFLNKSKSERSIKKQPLDNGKCCFTHGGKYMCAENDGLIVINRNTVSAWESFLN